MPIGKQAAEIRNREVIGSGESLERAKAVGLKA